LAIEYLPECTWNDTSGSKVRKSLQKLGDLWKAWSYLFHAAINCELFDLLDSFHHFECQDKDRIYAFAGLASDVHTSTELMPLWGYQEKTSLVPDYSLSDDELFFAGLHCVAFNLVDVHHPSLRWGPTTPKWISLSSILGTRFPTIETLAYGVVGARF
jgi:hypothetical protein